MTCSKCGAEILQGAAFCPLCGTSVRTGRNISEEVDELLRGLDLDLDFDLDGEEASEWQLEPEKKPEEPASRAAAEEPTRKVKVREERSTRKPREESTRRAREEAPTRRAREEEPARRVREEESTRRAKEDEPTRRVRLEDSDGGVQEDEPTRRAREELPVRVRSTETQRSNRRVIVEEPEETTGDGGGSFLKGGVVALLVIAVLLSVGLLIFSGIRLTQEKNKDKGTGYTSGVVVVQKFVNAAADKDGATVQKLLPPAVVRAVCSGEKLTEEGMQYELTRLLTEGTEKLDEDFGEWSHSVRILRDEDLQPEQQELLFSDYEEQYGLTLEKAANVTVELTLQYGSEQTCVWEVSYVTVRVDGAWYLDVFSLL